MRQPLEESARQPRPRISQILGEDHKDLDAQWERMGAVSDADLSTRRAMFASFSAGLLHHIAVEEELLFPPMETADPVRQALVARLREEHREIQEALRRIEDETTMGSKAWDELGSELVNVLWEHNAREEGAAYPWLDEHLSIAQILRVKRAMETRTYEGDR